MTNVFHYDYFLHEIFVFCDSTDFAALSSVTFQTLQSTLREKEQHIRQFYRMIPPNFASTLYWGFVSARTYQFIWNYRHWIYPLILQHYNCAYTTDGTFNRLLGIMSHDPTFMKQFPLSCSSTDFNWGKGFIYGYLNKDPIISPCEDFLIGYTFSGNNRLLGQCATVHKYHECFLVALALRKDIDTFQRCFREWNVVISLAIIVAATQSNCLKLVEFCLEEGGQQYISRVVNEAAYYGYEPLLQYCSQRYGPLNGVDILTSCAYHGHLHIAKFCVVNTIHHDAPFAIWIACIHGHMDFIRYCLGEQFPCDFRRCINHACQYGQEESLRLLIGECNDEFNFEEAMMHAAFGKQEAVIQLLENEYSMTSLCCEMEEEHLELLCEPEDQY